MNYVKIYDDLIISCILKKTKKSNNTETHHIIPKALGGSNDKQNLVELTHREHFISHILLAKIHGGNMWVPIARMRKKLDGTKINSVMYNEARTKIAENSRDLNKGKRTIRNKETGKCEQQDVNLVMPEGYEHMRTGYIQTDETKVLISEKKTGIPTNFSEEGKKNHKQKIVNSHKNGKRIETYKKISEARKGQPGNRNCFYEILSPNGDQVLVKGQNNLRITLKTLNLTVKLIPNINIDITTFDKSMISKKPFKNSLRRILENSVGWSVKKYKRIKI